MSARNQHFQMPSLITNAAQAIQAMNLVRNEFLLRQDWIRRQNQQLRDIDKECQYPEALSTTDYFNLYDREGIGTRVVNIYPEESWAMLPEIYETESLKDTTPFEAAWEKLQEDFNIFEMLQRIDRLSGIGRFGLLLLGVDGADNLAAPVVNIDEQGDPVEGKKKRKLLFIRALSERNVTVKEYETRTNNKRFGQPTMYEVDLVDTSDSSVQTKVVTRQTKVHWSRVIHIADNRQSSEIFGTPRLQHVFNRIWDLRKILSSNGEGYWKGSFPGLSLETQTGALEAGELDKEATKEQVKAYMEGMQRYLALEGMTANQLAPQISDPTPHFMTQTTAVCLSIGCPLRIFLGSEEGKQAAGQDMRRWNRRLGSRQHLYITPYMIRPLFDRLFAFGILPRPKKLITKWSDLNAPAENDKALNASKITEAMGSYVKNNIETLMDPKTFLVEVCGFSIEVVEENLKAVGNEIKKLKKMADVAANPKPAAGAGGLPRPSAKRTPKSKTSGAGPA